MQLIHDPPADGPANMARDVELLENLTDEPLLRIYHWSGNWASYGYFQSEPEAAAHFPPNESLSFVKRPTGGGIVDHRHDLTYTLFLPKSHPLAKVTRAHCYLRIHEIIQQALAAQDIPSELVNYEKGSSKACFAHPVPGDLIDSSGQKLAGAAQRRTRHGLIHQGSLLVPNLAPQAFALTLKNSFTTQFDKTPQK
jgi:lipoate-protein ligase A